MNEHSSKKQISDDNSNPRIFRRKIVNNKSLRREWTSMRGDVRPLDIIFFRGADFISRAISKIEEKMTGCGEYTHVGMVVDGELLPGLGLNPAKKYVWESTMSSPFSLFSSDGVLDEQTNRGFFGVQIRDLDDLVEEYLKPEGTSMAWGKLLNNPWEVFDNRQNISDTFLTIFKLLNHTSYDYNPLSLLSAAFPCLRFLRDKKEEEEDDETSVRSINRREAKKLVSDDMLFCSELVASVYCKLGVLGDHVDPQNALPVDFLGVDTDKEIKRMVEGPLIIKSVREISQEKKISKEAHILLADGN